jgi:hypothetical protein
MLLVLQHRTISLVSGLPDSTSNVRIILCTRRFTVTGVATRIALQTSWKAVLRNGLAIEATNLRCYAVFSGARNNSEETIFPSLNLRSVIISIELPSLI